MKQHLLQKDCAIQVARLVSEGRADIHIDPFLYSACQVDLKQLCFEVQPGEGRQFQCLTNALADGRKMHTECANKLKERVQLQKFAQEVKSPLVKWPGSFGHRHWSFGYDLWSSPLVIWL
jgi:golgi apparatus protein 1